MSPRSAQLRLAPLAAAPLAAALLAACATARPAVDPALASEERLAVAGRNGTRIGQTLRFGEFTADSVRRGLTRGDDRSSTGFDMVTRERARRRQGYRFALRSAADTTAAARWRGECAVTLEDRERRVGPIVREERRRQDVACTLVAGDGARWRLALATNDSTRTQGTLTREDGQGPPFALRPITRFAGSAFNAPAPLGWEFALDGRALGAVEQANGGAVILPRRYGEEVRRALAAASAALLLFDDLRETTDDAP